GTRDVSTPVRDAALLLPMWGGDGGVDPPVPPFLARGRPRRQERILHAAWSDRGSSARCSVMFVSIVISTSRRGKIRGSKPSSYKIPLLPTMIGTSGSRPSATCRTGRRGF